MDEIQSTIASTFTAFASQRIAKSLVIISSCISQLSEDQMHFRGGEHENSVINLLVHLEGNIRQWILSGMAEQPDVRDRDAEFALDIQICGADAIAALNATVTKARTVIEGVSPTRLMETLSGPLTGVQAIEGVPPVHLLPSSAIEPIDATQSETVLVTIAHIFSHLEYHAGQIVLLTKQRVGRDLDLTTPRKR